MFRTILSQLRKPVKLTTFASGFASKFPNHISVNDINEVKIVGTLISDSFMLQSGAKSLTVRTNDSVDKYSTHQVHTKLKANYTNGQRVYILGKLKTNPMRTNDGHLVNSSVVKARQVFLLDSRSAPSTSPDKNHVELLAYMATDVYVQDNYCSFVTATHFEKHTVDGVAEGLSTTYHRVYIYDHDLRENFENKLKKGNRILLTGRMDRRPVTLEDGKKAYAGCIVANNLYQIEKYTWTQTASNEGDKVEAETRTELG